METEGSLPHSQAPATCPYPEPDQSSPCLPSHLLEIHFNIILLSTPGSSTKPTNKRKVFKQWNVPTYVLIL